MEELITTTGGCRSSLKKKEGDKKKKSINLKAIKDIIMKEYENPIQRPLEKAVKS